MNGEKRFGVSEKVSSKLLYIQIVSFLSSLFPLHFSASSVCLFAWGRVGFCGEGTCSIYYKAPYKESGASSAEHAQTPISIFLYLLHWPHQDDSSFVFVFVFCIDFSHFLSIPILALCLKLPCLSDAADFILSLFFLMTVLGIKPVSHACYAHTPPLSCTLPP